MKIYLDKDIEDIITPKSVIGIIGYGVQGRAQALNLRDRGFNCIIGLRKGSGSYEHLENDGLEGGDIEYVSSISDILVFLVPDEVQKIVYEERVRGNLKDGALVIFGGGYSVIFDGLEVVEDVDVALVSPMAPGHLLRKRFVDNDGVPAKIGVHKDTTGDALLKTLSYAKWIGCGRRGCLLTDFRNETELDLFSEQVVLCGGIPALMLMAYDVLVENGYPEELAYIETIQEVKLIADIIAEFGISGMWKKISSTALYGGITRGERVIPEDTKSRLNEILSEIKEGDFAKEIRDIGEINREEFLEKFEKFKEIEERLKGLFYKEGD
jgi:ketol-acid reductoisomerase